MCGIAGVLSRLSANTERLSGQVKKMVQVLSHRGPDDQGIWADPTGRIILGHCRLAIIDLTPEGHQPMVSSCGRYVISLNGEIYDFLELRKELKELGTQFRGHSDTEVLLEAVSRLGIRRTLDKVVGMFAFALWDNAEDRLILARDRAGKKPLYYFRNHDSVYFASELKALKTLDNINFPVDYESIYQYLTFGYVPAPRTIYENVSEIPAGHYMVIDSNHKVEFKSYWKVAWGKKRQITFEQTVEEADHLLNEAVKIRLRADVPVGCFLSGGIDSGLLAAMASRQMDSPLKTFTVSFSDGAFDESPFADLVAKRYGTDHHVITLSPNLEDVLPKVVKAYDEPFADASAIPSYCISEEASKHIKVVLNGEGGDELFGGYRRHVAVKLYSHFRKLFEIMPEKFWSAVVESLPQPRSFRSRYAFLHRFLRGIDGNPFNQYIAWCVDGFDEIEKGGLYKHSTNGYASSIDLLTSKFSNLNQMHPLDHFMAMDFLLNMHDDMLVKMDIATMAHSLEGRNPFLDHRIIEWATNLPVEIKMKGTKTKPILRELAKRYLPIEIVNAPKRGFEIPLISWLRKDLFHMVHDICLSPNGIVLDLFNRNYVESLLNEKTDLDPDRWSRRVWTLFMLGMWENESK
jgi:asparagine synthase (glutamine-hydrolysing)